MSRWKPGARGRLEQAALALYSERGFEQTTVADIAERAGLAERTYFRHFTDKREVLFGGAGILQTLLEQEVANTPITVSPIETVAAALERIEIFSPERREASRQRQQIIAANPELQERELLKLASLSAALARVLQSRGAPETAALFAADAGMAIFRVAFERWTAPATQETFPQLVRAALAEFRVVITGSEHGEGSSER
ncbi:TetR/AcrR family transcriptional regulator (plasmid) [Deinococcus sp. KNUC1210]|uniref:TetR/AcrR family transcriptional regulator n=1 Tax=Deinococcus sp. KNUC1210 TaxID=2917691 RepID=UPI001EF00968|nr:TetR/AcrR family transcriptional regulator [Deinococcus sp. KNUC1210]ULH13855.1 TetR/AcrR family transcriptional regulator [Deinococcus sp. KNUC1210]